jgi:hypothetical protein
MRAIIEAAGGTWLPSNKVATTAKSNASAVIIVTSSEATEIKKQLKPKAVAAAIKSGAHEKTTTWLFHSMMTQSLDL